jgi:hypothetical protein
VLGLAGQSGWDHWALAVGVHHHLTNGEKCILLLDPANPAHAFTAWNSYVWMDRFPGGQYPHVYNDDDVEARVQIAHAMAIWKPDSPSRSTKPKRAVVSR